MDAIDFEILYSGLVSIAEEMGVVLKKSSYSPNIRERMDASCAIFSGDRRMLAQAEHIPVHLGSMHLPLNHIDIELHDGDQLLLNDPTLGGTHLPDLTVYKPVFMDNELVAFLGNRAHHADIGGVAPGSMPGNSTDIYQEGLILPPVKIMDEGVVNKGVMDILLANTRTPHERRGDIMAQLGANNYGARMMEEFISRCGIGTYHELETEIMDYTGRMVEKRIENLPRGTFCGEDVLEFREGEVRIRVRVTIGDRITVDFTGSSKACQGNINAPLAVTHSAVYFFFKTILGGDVPSNAAFYRFFDIVAPEGSVLNPPRGAAVVGGNVETSQRIVDALLLALSDVLELPAQSHGTMNNVSFGNTKFSYYETLGGGAGATRGTKGASGVHVYMTNTRNTPVEVIEANFPLLCLGYHLREGSGGAGRWRGGEGLIKHYKVTEPCSFSVLSDRRRVAPCGAAGGGDGAVGRNVVIKNGVETVAPGKCTVALDEGDEVMVMTPGGGGCESRKATLQSESPEG